jgi:hypothetical protein
MLSLILPCSLDIVLILFSDQFEKLQQDYRSMQVEHYQLKEEYDDLKEKMRFFTKVIITIFSNKK